MWSPSSCAGLIRLLAWLCISTIRARAAHPTTLKQAWQQWCGDTDHLCKHHAGVPEKAYVISLPEDSGKREFLIPQLDALGMDVEVVDGMLGNQLGEDYTKCHGAATSKDCQTGLTRAHIEAWRRLMESGKPAAWIFEDDAIFHDDVLQLWSEYWAGVPKDFQFVFVGQVYPWGEQPNTAAHAAPATTPWGTHAYIIRAGTAERLARLGEWMIERALLENEDKSAWELDGDDIKIDHFIKNYYQKLLPGQERQKWIIFGTPSYLPWSYGRVLAHGSNECRCQCNVEECLRSGLAPVEPSTGLASQHRCKDIAKLIEWHKEVKRKHAGKHARHCGATDVKPPARLRPI